MSDGEMEIEMDEILGLPLPESIEESSNNIKRLVVKNVALQSWVPSLAVGFLLVIFGVFFFFVQDLGNWAMESLFSISLIGNGLIFIFSATKETCVFEEIEGKLKIYHLTWRGMKIYEYWLLHIKDVEIEEYKDPQGGNDYSLSLRMRSGQQIELFSGHMIGVGKSRKEKAQREIKEFLEHFNNRYTTKTRASHSAYKTIMKRQLGRSISANNLTQLM